MRHHGQVPHDSLLDNPEEELRALTDYLGLRWEPKLLDHQETARERGYIRTPSYHQVTQGLYQSSRGRWQAYRAMMEPALPILAPSR